MSNKTDHPTKVSYPDLIKRLQQKEAEKAAREIRERGQRPSKKKTDREHQVQSACVRWFNLQYPQHKGLLFAVPNGGKRNAVVAAKLKAEGVVSGVADLMLAMPRLEKAEQTGESSWTNTIHGLFIEMKTTDKYSRQSPSQRLWQKLVEQQGYQYSVCHTIEEFMQTIKQYLS